MQAHVPKDLNEKKHLIGFGLGLIYMQFCRNSIIANAIMSVYLRCRFELERLDGRRH